MPLSTGTRLGPYEIVYALGAGGMGEDISDTLASVLRGEPDWSALPTETAHLTSVLQRCLEKDVKRRLRDIADVKLLLEAAPWSQVVTRGAPSKRAAWMWATAVL